MVLRGKVVSPQALGLMLQQARLAVGLTQQQLADELSVSQRYVWEMESGKQSLAMTRLFAIMRRTGMTLTAEIPGDDGMEVND